MLFRSYMVRILTLVLDVNRIIGLALIALADKQNLNRRRALKGRNRGNRGHLTNCLDLGGGRTQILRAARSALTSVPLPQSSLS